MKIVAMALLITAVVNINDLSAAELTIIGTATQGQDLIASISGISDDDDLEDIAYQWLRNDAVISGATDSRYTLVQDDVNNFIRVRVYLFIDDDEEVSLTSKQTSAVANINDLPAGELTIIGSASQGQVLTADTSAISDADGLGVFSYQWLRDGANITGATGDSYTLVQADLGTFIVLRVTYKDDFGVNEVVVSEAKGPVFADVPKVSPPPAIGPVNATGWFTYVDIEQVTKASATDALDGMLTPVADSEGYFRPGETTVIWSATDSAGNVGTATQIIKVTPLVEISKQQRSAEGSDARFKISLNGDALRYPVKVPYLINSVIDDAVTYADKNDHNLVDGDVEITAPAAGELPEAVAAFHIKEDFVSEGTEILTITLTRIGKKRAVLLPAVANTVHTVEIIEGNLAPLVSLEATQRQLDQNSSPLTVSAKVIDANDTDRFSYDWSQTDQALINASNLISADSSVDSFTIDPKLLLPGFYTVHVLVNDGAAEVTSRLLLNVLSALPVLGTEDSDADGISDKVEGYGDKDSDGVPDYLDAIQAAKVMQILPGVSDKFIMQTETGLKLSLGDIALKTGHGSIFIEQADITAYSSGTNKEADTIANVGGYFDFVVSGLPVAGQTVRVVIPQLVAMPRQPVYRKLASAGWQDFVGDANNRVYSAAGAKGYCPSPGHADYKPGLAEGHWCLLLLIEDGGPNDSDGVADNRVTDPGGVGGILTDVNVNSSGSGGSWHPLVPVLSIFIMLTLRNKKQVEKKAA